MIEKPIMIDDVDVSECEHHCNTHKELLADGNIKIFANYCQINNDGCYAINCYFKQLKLKEEECEELLEFNNSLVEEHKTIGNDLYKEIKEYRKKLQAKEQECEELNNTITNLENTKEELLTKIDQLKAENEELQEKIKAYDEVYSNHDVLNERNNYKQALQQIRQVVEFAMEEVLTIGQRNATAKILEILQKCEVLDEV